MIKVLVSAPSNKEAKWFAQFLYKRMVYASMLESKGRDAEAADIYARTAFKLFDEPRTKITRGGIMCPIIKPHSEPRVDAGVLLPDEPPATASLLIQPELRNGIGSAMPGFAAAQLLVMAPMQPPALPASQPMMRLPAGSVPASAMAIFLAVFNSPCLK